MELNLSDLSRAREALVERVAAVAVMVGGDGVTPRTGTRISPTEVATIALDAEPGESVAVTPAPHSDPVAARVVRFDRGSGVAILALPAEAASSPASDRPGVAGGDHSPHGDDAPATPADATVTPHPGSDVRLGGVTLTVAFPSPEGHEARFAAVRCVGRDGTYLQTDAPVFPGFAGAPVFDGAGVLIGVTALGAGGNDAMVWPIGRVRALAAGEPITTSVPRPRLGVATQTVPLAAGIDDGGDRSAALVVDVESGSPAEAAGLRYGDVIVRVGERRIAGADDLAAAIGALAVGAAVPVAIVRAGATEVVAVTPDVAPPSTTRGGNAHAHGGRGRRGGGGGRWQRWATAAMTG